MEDWIDFQWTVHLNRELKARILELGSDAEVLTPEVLRQETGEAIREAALKYQSLNPDCLALSEEIGKMM